KKLNRFVLASRWFFAPSRKAAIPFTMCLPNRCRSLPVVCRHRVSRRKWLPDYGTTNDRQRKTPLSRMDQPMNTNKLPQSDSIQELAQFWDANDLTDFENELQEVTEPVFEHKTTVMIELSSEDAEVVKKTAKAKGLNDAELIREWVVEKVHSL